MPRRVPLPPELGRRPFTVTEARELGLGEGRLRHADLSRPTRGVRQAGKDPNKTALAQLAEATGLVLPVGSAFSHLTAARLLGLPMPRHWAPSEPELNVVINDRHSGQWLSDSDFVWRQERVVAEFDGDHHRTDRQQWQNDVARRENLQDDGWAFMQLTSSRP